MSSIHYSTNLNDWLISHKYVNSDTRGFGMLYNMTEDYDVYVIVSVKAKALGVTVSRAKKEYFIGKLKSFKTQQTENIVKNKTTTTYVNSGGGGGFYEEGLEEKLGGNKKTLGV